MAWVKFSDNFPHHPKVIGLSNEAFRLHVEAMCHANHYLTDGIVTFGAADALATTIVRALFLTVSARASDGFPAPDPTRDLPAPFNVVEELLEAGIWDKVKVGYAIHDYHKYQPPREEIEARQQAGQLARQTGGRVRAAGAARDEKGRLLPQKTQLTQLDDQLDHQLPPRPVPVPVREGVPTTNRLVAGATVAEGFDEFWRHFPRKVGKEKALAVWRRMKAPARTKARAVVVAFAEAWRRATPDRVQFIPHPATWLGQGRFDDDPAEWKRQATGAPKGNGTPPPMSTRTMTPAEASRIAMEEQQRLKTKPKEA